jgi:hypothetical protein
LVKKLKRERTVALGLTVSLTLEVADDENFSTNTFFTNQREQLVTLSARYKIP